MKHAHDTSGTAESALASTVPETRVPLNGFVVADTRPLRRIIRRQELHRMVPLADTTIYDLERRGEFPRRFNITARCVVWDAAEVEAWLEARRKASDTSQLKRAPSPDVRQRRRNPVKASVRREHR